jgi:hypothetical protein
LVLLVLRNDVNPCAVRRVYGEALEIIFSFRRIDF